MGKLIIKMTLINTNKKLEVFAQEISGIVYYLDNYGNAYNTEDIMKK